MKGAFLQNRPLLPCTLGLLAGSALLFAAEAKSLEALFVLFLLFFCALCFFFFSFFKKSSVKKRRSLRRAAVVFSFVLAGVFRALVCLQAEERAISALSRQESVCVIGTVKSRQRKEDSLLLTLRGVLLVTPSAQKGLSIGNAFVYLPVKNAGDDKTGIRSVAGGTFSDVCLLGTRVIVSGTRLPIRTRQNEGGYDEKTALLGKGVSLKMKAESGKAIEKAPLSVITGISGEGISIAEALQRLRESMAVFYDTHLPGEEASILRSMTLGDTSLLDPAVRDLYSAGGIGHILAVSGLHISFVGMFLFHLLRKAGLPVSFCGAAAAGGAFLYCAMTGASSSALRAAVMFSVLILAKIFGESYDTASALSLCAMFFLLIRPTVLFDMSFVFSFSSSFGVAFAMQPVAAAGDRYFRYRRAPALERAASMGKKINNRPGIRERFLTNLGANLAITLFTAPLLAYYQASLPVHVLLLSLLLLPLVRFVILFGLFGGILRIPALLFPCHLFLYGSEALCSRLRSLHGSGLVTGQPSLPAIACFYALLLFSICLLCRRMDQHIRRHRKEETAPPVKKTLPMAVLICSLCLILLLCSVRTKEFSLTMLSVGQGDGLVVTAPDGSVFLIDGGSSSTEHTGLYVLRPFLRTKGIRRVNLWFVTHTDEDHCSGILEMLQLGWPVDELVFAENVIRDEHFYELIGAAEKNGTRVRFMKKGQKAESGGEDAVRFLCLYDGDPENTKDANGNSLTLLLSYRMFDAVLTGDIGQAQEEAMLADPQTNSLLCGRQIEILKGAHHGSSGSNSAAWLSALRPKCVLFSAGENNIYHHPSQETLDRLKQEKIPSFCTIFYGQLTVTVPKDGSSFQVHRICYNET